MKVKRSITIDREINEILVNHPTLNVSALANLLLKQYLKENNMK